MDYRRDVFQALADPTRREIISLLARKPQHLNAIADQFDMSRQAISLHVKILQECGVISITKEGRERHCSLQVEKLTEVSQWLEPFRQLWQDRFNQLDNVLLNFNPNDHEK
jgi:DNA-binding transcriptional ArsR family regulator